MVDPLFDIEGRTLLLAGAAGGLGATVADGFASRGAHVVAADLNEAPAEALAARLPGQGHAACAIDVTDEASCRQAVERARSLTGRLDIVINASGLFEVAAALEMPLETFRKTLEVNVTGAFCLSRTAAVAMAAAGGGRIVNLASVSSTVVNPGYAAYAASKAALKHMTRVLALEWAQQGVTVNAIGPAMTATPLTEKYLRETGNYDYAMSRIPMGRFGKPEDLLGTALLLASPAGAFITGQIIYVDGGRTCA
jgi:NAD(P)-dependent dehydrogenase (short-subunit alcohol dehydrogenase family)